MIVNYFTICYFTLMSKCRSPKQYIEFYDKEKRRGAAHINLEDNKRVLDRITH